MTRIYFLFKIQPNVSIVNKYLIVRKETYLWQGFKASNTLHVSYTIYIFFFQVQLNNNFRTDQNHMSPFLKVLFQLSKNMADSWVERLYQTQRMSTRNQQSWVARIALKSFGALLSLKKKCLDLIKQSLQSLHYRDFSKRRKRTCWTSATSVIQHEEKQLGHLRS